MVDVIKNKKIQIILYKIGGILLSNVNISNLIVIALKFLLVNILNNVLINNSTSLLNSQISFFTRWDLT